MSDEINNLSAEIEKIDLEMKEIYLPMKKLESEFKKIQNQWTILANQKRKLEIKLWENSGKIKTKKLKAKAKVKVKSQPKSFNSMLKEIENKSDLLAMIAQLENQIKDLAD